MSSNRLMFLYNILLRKLQVPFLSGVQTTKYKRRQLDKHRHSPYFFYVSTLLQTVKGGKTDGLEKSIMKTKHLAHTIMTMTMFKNIVKLV